jgi:hypothetical protein
MLLGFSLAAAAEKQPQPVLQLQLADLGYQGSSKAVLDTGSSMLTVHYLDNTHLLVSFGLRKLIPRIADDPKEHDDRLVGAEVVELPSGKIVAKTEWRTHDHGRYLWSLGHGRFLVRLGERLYTIAPLARLTEKDPFERTLVPSRPFQPAAIFVSPEGGMVTVETRLKASRKVETAVENDKDFTSGTSVESFMLLDFYRVKGEGNAAFPVTVERAGSVRSPQGFLLPINADGYLWATEKARNHWEVTFDGFGGAALKLGAIDSSCIPRMQLLSGSEYLAITCRGTDDNVLVASYGFDGKETWEEPMGQLGPPYFAFAADAGRFAMSKTIDAVAPATTSANSQGSPERQEVRVYQNASGDLLLRVDCQPVMKSGQNFDLAPDGMAAAVVRNDAIAIYKLPPLSKQDKRDIAEVAGFAPPKSDAPVKLTRLTVPVSAPTDLPTLAATETKPAVAPVAAKEPVVNTIVNGDIEQAERTSPPTLLNPGEKPEYGKANGSQPR